MCYTQVVGTIALIKNCCKNSLAVTKLYTVVEEERFQLLTLTLARICYKHIYIMRQFDIA